MSFVYSSSYNIYSFLKESKESTTLIPSVVGIDSYGNLVDEQVTASNILIGKDDFEDINFEIDIEDPSSKFLLIGTKATNSLITGDIPADTVKVEIVDSHLVISTNNNSLLLAAVKQLETLYNSRSDILSNDCLYIVEDEIFVCGSFSNFETDYSLRGNELTLVSSLIPSLVKIISDDGYYVLAKPSSKEFFIDLGFIDIRQSLFHYIIEKDGQVNTGSFELEGDE